METAAGTKWEGTPRAAIFLHVAESSESHHPAQRASSPQDTFLPEPSAAAGRLPHPLSAPPQPAGGYPRWRRRLSAPRRLAPPRPAARGLPGRTGRCLPSLPRGTAAFRCGLPGGGGGGAVPAGPVPSCPGLFPFPSPFLPPSPPAMPPKKQQQPAGGSKKADQKKKEKIIEVRPGPTAPRGFGGGGSGVVAGSGCVG